VKQSPPSRRVRSHRDFALETRLMRHPLSDMVYTPMFDALPETARDVVVRATDRCSHGARVRARYAHLAAEERQAILEIPCDSKASLADASRRAEAYGATTTHGTPHGGQSAEAGTTGDTRRGASGATVKRCALRLPSCW
jgi:hypothetical protein